MKQRTSGQALVELALVLPLFLFILLGAIDFGRVIFAHTAISRNADAAARAVSVSADRPPFERENEIVEQLRLILPGVPYTDANYDWTDEDGLAVVDIVVDVPIVTPIVAQMVGGAVTVSAHAEERMHD